MERKDIIKKLVNEGMSEKTLANFNDKQIVLLADRILNEQIKKGNVVMPKSTATPSDVDKFTKTGQNVELREKLIGGQKELDKNKNGKLDSKDFEMLRNQNDESYDMEEEEMSNEPSYKNTAKYMFLKDLQTDPDFIEFKKNTIYDTGRGFESFGTPKADSKDYYKNNDENDEYIYDDDTLFESKKKPSAGLSKEKKSEIVKKAKAGKDVGKKGKTFKDIEAKAKASGAKEPKAVAAAAMWKNIKRESKNENTEIKEWLNNIVETEYHPFTSKNEILSLIKSKLNK